MRIHLISALFLVSAACAKTSSSETAEVVIITDSNTNPGATTSKSQTTSDASKSKKPSSDSLITSSASSHTSSTASLNAAVQATDAYVVSILQDREALYSFLQNTVEALSFYQSAYELKYGTAWSDAIVSDLSKVTATDGASSILVAYESIVPQITANPESDTARYASLLSEFESAQSAWLEFFTPSATTTTTEGQAVVSWVTATASAITTLSMLEVATTASKAGSASKLVPLIGLVGGMAVALL